jgi:hypothetical protein
VTKASAQCLTGIAASTAAGEALGAARLSPRELGAACARELKAEQPITPELAARLAGWLMSGVPKKRDEGKAPAA